MTAAQTPTKSRRLRRILIIAGIIVVVFGSLASYSANASKLPEAVNMSSAMDMTAATPMGSLVLGQSDAPLKAFTLTAEVVKRVGLPDQWGFNGTVPGPELRVQQGDHVRVTLVNHLPAATSIHWHGVDVPNAEDGVAGVTQDAVKPGQSYTYDFIASEPGTYWYHSHQDTSNQVPLGLLGALIVEPENLPHYDHDFTLIYHDFKPLPRDFFSIVQKIAGKIDHEAIAINGINGDLGLSAKAGELVRLRLINGTAGEESAYGDPLRIALLGTPFQVVALDGHDLNEPQAISAEILPIGAGQRYDLVFRMPDTGVVRLVVENLTATVTLGQGQITTPDLTKLATFDLTTYGKPTYDALASRTSFDNVQDIVLGNHPGFHDGKFGLSHTINGQEFPDVPMIMVQYGQAVKLHIVNNTDEYHPIHLHGHTFTVLARNNIALTGSPVHVDTIMLAPGETWDVAFIANNPGLWMLHCHILLHAVTGMDMMLMYPDITTPYTVGTASGNVPE